MIAHVEGYRYKYVITEPVTVDDIKKVFSYYISIGWFRCIICNYNTCKLLNIKPGDSFVTINNHIEDGAFYVNRIV